VLKDNGGASDADGDVLSVTQFIVNGVAYRAGGPAAPVLDDRGNRIGTLTMDAQGEYRLTPVRDWYTDTAKNRVVPQISYVVSDGTDTSTATLDITVLPVNDAPESGDAAGGEVEGRSYLFTQADFAFANPAAFEEDDELHAVIIDSLPAQGTLFLDGVAVTAAMVATGLTVTVADLQAGKLTYRTPNLSGKDALGNDAQFTLAFRVQDTGGTENGGQDTSDAATPYTFTLTVDQFIHGDNGTDNTLTGGAGHDVILGDVGGLKSQVVNDQNYNIALLVDMSGSMTTPWGWGNPRPTRIDSLKASLKSLVENYLTEHQGNVNVALITFPATRGGRPSPDFFLENLNSANLQSMLDAIDSLAMTDSHTPYGYGFNKTTNWFNAIQNQTDGDGNKLYDGYENLTYFLTDGDPNSETDFFRDNAFQNLVQISPKVHAIGIGTGVNKVTLDRYDTTDMVPAFDSTTFTPITNFTAPASTTPPTGIPKVTVRCKLLAVHGFVS